jgi:hypothetical protein
MSRRQRVVRALVAVFVVGQVLAAAGASSAGAVPSGGSITATGGFARGSWLRLDWTCPAYEDDYWVFPNRLQPALLVFTGLGANSSYWSTNPLMRGGYLGNYHWYSEGYLNNVGSSVTYQLWCVDPTKVRSWNQSLPPNSSAHYQAGSVGGPVAAGTDTTPSTPVAAFSYRPTGTPNQWRLDGTGSMPTDPHVTLDQLVFNWTAPGGACSPILSVQPQITTCNFPAGAYPTVTLQVYNDIGGLSNSITRQLVPGLQIATVTPSVEPASGNFNVHVTVRNDATTPATGVAVSSNFLPSTLVQPGAGTPTPATADIAPGATQAFDIPAVVTGVGQASAYVHASGVIAAVTATDDVRRVFTVGAAPLTASLDLSPATSVGVGGTATADLQVTNHSGQALTGLAAQLTAAPTGLLTIGSATGGATTLIDGASTTFHFPLTGVAAGSVQLTANASGIGSAGPINATAIQKPYTIGTSTIAVNRTGDDPNTSTATSNRLCDTDDTAVGDQCSLRAAIELANAWAEVDAVNISFDIDQAGVPTITPASPLPRITKTVTIDGATQPGGWVEISGAAILSGTGLDVAGNGTVIHGLVIRGFASGTDIALGGQGGHAVAGNRLGTDSAGATASGDHIAVLINSPDNTVGGNNAGPGCADPCNLIAAPIVDGDTPGTGTNIQGNWIGVDASGEVAFGGQDAFIHVGHALIGGSTTTPGTGLGNVISPNSPVAISLTGNAVVAGNIVGLDPTGLSILQPSDLRDVGVVLIGATGIRIGGTAGERNVITGGFRPFNEEGGSAVWIIQGGGDVIVRNNYIGTDISGNRVPANAPAGGWTQRPDVAFGNYEAVHSSFADGQLLLDDNVISGNQTGVFGEAPNDQRLVMRGNRVGTNPAGTAEIPNLHGGFWQGAATIGGTRASGGASCESPCNLISGNGIGFSVYYSTDVTSAITGNFVGTDPSGLAAIPNEIGLDVHGAHVGGTSHAANDSICDGACNLIAANTVAGITSESLHDWIRGNAIGIGLDGRHLGNDFGIVTQTAADSVIGGDQPGFGNRVAWNTQSAIDERVHPAQSAEPVVDIEGNAMFGNGAALTSALPGLPPIPQISQAVRIGSAIRVMGLHPVTSAIWYRVDVYGELSCQGGSGDQGLSWLGGQRFLAGTGFDVQLSAPNNVTGVVATLTDLSIPLSVTPAQNGPTGRFSTCRTTALGTTLSTAAQAGDTEITPVSNAGWAPGDYAQIDTGVNTEIRRVGAVGSLVFDAPLAAAHPAGTLIVKVTPPQGDTTAPTITVTTPVNNATFKFKTKVTGVAGCADTGVGVEQCVVGTIDTSTIGAHVFTVKAWDHNGNYRSISVAYNVVHGKPK